MGVAAQVNNETQDLNYPVTGEANLNRFKP